MRRLKFGEPEHLNRCPQVTDKWRLAWQEKAEGDATGHDEFSLS